MRKPRELKTRCFMHILKTDKTVPIEQLTPEEWEYCIKEMRERLSRNMSDYYAQDSKSFELLEDCSETAKKCIKIAALEEEVQERQVK